MSFVRCSTSLLLVMLTGASAQTHRYLASQLRYGDGVTFRAGYLDMHGADTTFQTKAWVEISESGNLFVVAKGESRVLVM